MRLLKISSRGRVRPGHLGELTQILDFDRVDAVAQETQTGQPRVRLLLTGAFWRGPRTVAIEATSTHVPDCPAVTARYRKRRDVGACWRH